MLPQSYFSTTHVNEVAPDFAECRTDLPSGFPSAALKRMLDHHTLDFCDCIHLNRSITVKWSITVLVIVNP